ncbi:MAG TPA: TonB-dependent receptor [Candidatus Baltobacteraceae bacterium]|nr:TonB-dependent receptor [Candidatus Baltobacteraceae bacterium]
MVRVVRACLAILIALACPMAAFAQTPHSITGTVTDARSAPIGGAKVVLSGPKHESAVTGANGSFSFDDLPDGTYNVSIIKGGYEPAGVESVRPGDAPLTIALDEATMSTIRQIAHVSVSARGSFNTSSAAQTFVGSQQFRNAGDVQTNHVLDRVPGVVSARSGGTNAAVAGAIMSPNLRGALDYEKESLLDGHPLINGRFGDYPIMFLNQFLLDGIEIAQGPTANAAQINYGIGGTVNFRTAEPTRTPYGDIVLGTDGYGGGYSNVRYSGTTTNGKLGWVLDYATYGTRGPLNNYPAIVSLPSGSTIAGYGTIGGTTSSKPINGASGPFPVSNATGNPNNAYVTLVACCQPVNSSYLNHGELAKLRYAFSPSTSLTLSYFGLQSQYDNTASGFTQLYSTFAPAAGYAGGAGAPVAGLPVLMNASTQIPGRRLTDSEPVLQAEFRTTLHNDSIVARFYGAALDRFTSNPLSNPQSDYTTAPLQLWGTATIGGVTTAFNGQSAAVTIKTPYFQQGELDQLRGESLEYDHPIGANLLTFSFDRSTYLTNAFQVTGNASKPQGNVSIPIPAGSRQDFTTYLLRGIWQLDPKTELTLANYFNVYQSHFTTARAGGGFAFADATRTHVDPRIGIAYHPNGNTSLRFTAGSAVAPPFIQLLDGLSQTPAQVYTPGATSITIAQNSGGLSPETSFGYDIGGDFRLPNGAVLSADAYLTDLRNQFVGTVTPQGTYTPPGSSTAIPVYVSTNANLGKARFEGIQATLRKDVPVGVGYIFSAALQRAYPYGIDPSFYATAAGPYTTNLGVLPGLNYIGDNKPFFNGISNKSEAYAQGFAQVDRRWEHGQYFALGLTYYGPNNTYNVPAFGVMNATYRFNLAPQTSLQISDDNVLGAYANPWVQQTAGIPAPLVTGQLGLRNAVPFGPSAVHLQIERRFGP